MTKHFQREKENLNKMLLRLGAMTEEAVQNAIEAIEKRDIRIANKVITTDTEIDKMEVELEEECLKLLALYQPVASDLRFIVTALKINNDLERIGDLAVNLAERAEFLSTTPSTLPSNEFHLMTKKVMTMLKQSLDSFMNNDAELAREVLVADNEVDALNRAMYSKAQQNILEQHDQAESMIHILSSSRYLERIGDLATNIAEDVIYMLEGEIIRHRKHKTTPPPIEGGNKEQPEV